MSCSYCATDFVQEKVVVEKGQEEKFEFPIEHYLEVYGPANDAQKSLFLQAKKEYKDDFSSMDGSPFAKKEDEVLYKSSLNFDKAIALNPYYKQDILRLQRQGKI